MSNARPLTKSQIADALGIHKRTLSRHCLKNLIWQKNDRRKIIAKYEADAIIKHFGNPNFYENYLKEINQSKPK
jgi:hypothetical protein